MEMLTLLIIVLPWEPIALAVCVHIVRKAKLGRLWESGIFTHTFRQRTSQRLQPAEQVAD
jgi:hypothetical protein